MNDLTRYETEYLYDLVYFAIEDCQEPDVAYDCREKLKTKLDEFCKNNEHLYDFSLGKGLCRHCGEFE